MALDVGATTSLRVYLDGSGVPGTSTLDAVVAERVPPCRITMGRVGKL